MLCDNLMCAVKLLANLQTGGDNNDTIFDGLQEQRLMIMDELRRFIEVVILKIILRRSKWSGPTLTARFPDAAVKGVGELALRRGEEGVLRSFINTTNVVNSTWWTPLVDEYWHAVCQTIYKCVEGPE